MFRELIHACHLSLEFQILFSTWFRCWSIFLFLLRLELIIIKCLAHNTKRQLSNIFNEAFCHSNYVCVIRLLPWLSYSHQSFQNEMEKRKKKVNEMFRVSIIIKHTKTQLHITHGNLKTLCPYFVLSTIFELGTQRTEDGLIK